MNRVKTLARLEEKHARTRAAFLAEYVAGLRISLVEERGRRARYLEDHGREWQPPPKTPEQAERFRLTKELLLEWRATQKR